MDPTERDLALVNSGYVDEGIAFHVFSNPQAKGWHPLIRMFNQSTGDHLYTRSRTEEIERRQEGYRTELVSRYHNNPPFFEFSPYFCAYVAGQQEPGTLPLYRLFHPTLQDSFYSTDENEIIHASQTMGYRQLADRLIVGFVFPKAQQMSGSHPESEPVFRLRRAVGDPAFPVEPTAGPTVAAHNVSWSQLRDQAILAGQDAIGMQSAPLRPPANPRIGAEIEFWVEVASEVNDWKEVRLFDAAGRYFGENTFPFDPAGQGISFQRALNPVFVGRWPISALAGANLVFSKAKLFGVHTGMYQLPLNEPFRATCR